MCDELSLTLCIPPASSVQRISQARILEWVASSLSMGSFPIQGSNPGIKPTCPASPALAGRFYTTESPGKPKVEIVSFSSASYIRN